MGVKDSFYIKSAAMIPDDTLFNVGMCKLNGIGMDKDEEEAAEILRILAERGFVPAMKPLADYYRKIGEDALADKWIRLGKGSGDISSRIDMYLRNEINENEVNNRPLSFTQTSNQSSNNLEQLVKKVLPHVVMIVAPGEAPGSVVTGSGFILDGGIVITNEHVVGRNPKNVCCVFEPSIDNKQYNLIPIATSHEYDLAVLGFDENTYKQMAEKPHLKIRTGELNFAEQIFTVGSPMGLGLSVSHGIVSNPKNTTMRGGWPYVIQSDMSINTGNSGGAIFDMNGNVVGVATFIYDGAQGGLSFASPAECLLDFLNKVFK